MIVGNQRTLGRFGWAFRSRNNVDQTWSFSGYALCSDLAGIDCAHTGDTTVFAVTFWIALYITYLEQLIELFSEVKKTTLFA